MEGKSIFISEFAFIKSESVAFRPGGHTPYRIYIDSGVVFLCTVSLSIVSPLIAPCALLYFLFCTPLWRRQLIFVYRYVLQGLLKDHSCTIHLFNFHLGRNLTVVELIGRFSSTCSSAPFLSCRLVAII